MGSAYQTTTTVISVPSTATAAASRQTPVSNSRKRSASVAFPSPQSPRKASRPDRATFPHQPQAGLLTRWSAAVGSIGELLIDTAAYLLTLSTPPTQIAAFHPMPSDLTPASTSASDASSSKTSSVSSIDSPPSRNGIPRHINKPMLMKSRNTSHEPQTNSRKRVRHIYYEQHKEIIKEKKKRVLYLIERAKGYTSDFSTFKSFLEYKQRVAEATHTPGYVKPSHSKTAQLDTSIHESERLRRAIERARDSLAGPGPDKPFIPTFEQLRIADKAKDLEITNRIRYPLPTELPEQARCEVQAILKNPQFVSKVGREQVTHKDVQRLNPGSWLNDELINFYGQLIVERSLAQEPQKENIDTSGRERKGKSKHFPLRIHFFNTFFWPKLQQGYAKSNLRKWTKKVDLFSKDLVLIPINHNQMHWSAAVLNFRDKRIESYDSLDAENLNKGTLFALLRNYLQEEHRDKKGSDFDFSGWQNFGRPDTPQQENGFDCGVFTMNFLESVARGAEFGFKQSNMPYLRQRMIWEIGRAKLEGQL